MRKFVLVSLVVGCFFAAGRLYAFIPEGANINQIRKEIIAQRQDIQKRYKEKVRLSEARRKTQLLGKGKNIPRASAQPYSDRDISQKTDLDFSVPYWMKFFLGGLFILSLWWYLFILSRKYYNYDINRMKKSGFSLLELIIAMTIFVIVLAAVGAVYSPVRILFNRLNSSLDDTSVSREINYVIFKHLSCICEDTNHKVEISGDGSCISFYICGDGTTGGVDFVGPIKLYLSNNRVFLEQNGTAHPIGRDVSSLHFNRNGDKIMIHEVLRNGDEFFSQVAIRTCEY